MDNDPKYKKKMNYSCINPTNKYKIIPNLKFERRVESVFLWVYKNIRVVKEIYNN